MHKNSLSVDENYDYEDSGVEWLGKIPAHWKLYRFKYIASIMTGDKDTAHRNYAGAYPFFIRSPKIQKIDTYSYDGEAILTAGDGDIGKIFHYINGKFDYHQRVYKFSEFKKVYGKYLYYYLKNSLAEEVVKLSAKTTVDSLRLPFLQNFPVAAPPLREQNNIYKFLDKNIALIDQSIKIKQHQIDLLKERKQILIQNAVTRGLNPDAPMRDSCIPWIGQIPAHWKILRFKHLFSQSRIPVRLADGVVTSYRDGQVTLRSKRRIDGYTEAILEQGYQGVRKGQLVVNSMDAFEGAIGVSDSDGKCTPEYIVCDPRSEEYDPGYFSYLLREMALARYIQVICHAVRQRAVRIRYNNLANLSMAIPPKSEQIDIVYHIKSESLKVDKAIALLQDQIERLKEYRATLIDSAVTGKIRVPGVEDPAPALSMDGPKENSWI
ncbi:restriction endonuclease subunit S [Halomonas sp. G15]|uniref:restriction endonuclease subunit S n=1 Tax=Halomonas sp. G15 TaxID=2903521 RepID=UPI001E318AC1|nr:restriction endonuclease subunit S [Halomonas sp. G15]MCE0732799.1 restriction endonuclease subunit S [Halomonas sp. G15]